MPGTCVIPSLTPTIAKHVLQVTNLVATHKATRIRDNRGKQHLGTNAATRGNATSPHLSLALSVDKKFTALFLQPRRISSTNEHALLTSNIQDITNTVRINFVHWRPRRWGRRGAASHKSFRCHSNERERPIPRFTSDKVLGPNPVHGVLLDREWRDGSTPSPCATSGRSHKGGKPGAAAASQTSRATLFHRASEVGLGVIRQDRGYVNIPRCKQDLANEPLRSPDLSLGNVESSQPWPWMSLLCHCLVTPQSAFSADHFTAPMALQSDGPPHPWATERRF